MLRTFDELGYRQEQRFHFELGLLKLVHLQRLLPVEEAPHPTRRHQIPTHPLHHSHKTVILGCHESGCPIFADAVAGVGPRNPLPTPGHLDRANSRPTADKHLDRGRILAVKPLYPHRCHIRVPHLEPSRRALRFGPPQSRHPREAAHERVPASSLAAASAQSKDPEAVRPPLRLHLSHTTDGSLALAPEPALKTRRPSATRPSSRRPTSTPCNPPSSPPSPPPKASRPPPTPLARRHPGPSPATRSASKPAVSKTMLPVALQRRRRPHPHRRAPPMPPSSSSRCSPAAPAPPPQRSHAPPHPARAAELAEKHPMVQEAKRLFSAEISNVIDLRDKTRAKAHARS